MCRRIPHSRCSGLSTGWLPDIGSDDRSITVSTSFDERIPNLSTVSRFPYNGGGEGRVKGVVLTSKLIDLMAGGRQCHIRLLCHGFTGNVEGRSKPDAALYIIVQAVMPITVLVILFTRSGQRPSAQTETSSGEGIR